MWGVFFYLFFGRCKFFGDEYFCGCIFMYVFNYVFGGGVLFVIVVWVGCYYEDFKISVIFRIGEV